MEVIKNLKVKRNALICSLYNRGATTYELSSAFNLTQAAIVYILKCGKVVTRNRGVRGKDAKKYKVYTSKTVAA